MMHHVTTLLILIGWSLSLTGIARSYWQEQPACVQRCFFSIGSLFLALHMRRLGHYIGSGDYDTTGKGKSLKVDSCRRRSSVRLRRQ
jgi:hypothetical protein